MAIVGGSADARGPVFGALFLVVLSDLVWSNFPQVYMIVLGALLIGFVLFAPNGVNGGGIMLHARRPGGPVAAAQKCATHGPLSVATRGRRCTAWSSMRRFDWRLSTRV